MQKGFIMRLIILTILCFMCTWATADGWIDQVVAKITTSQSTGAVANEASTTKITGYIQRIDITVAETTNIVESVVVATSNEFTGIKTTLRTLTDVTANASYQYSYTNINPVCVLNEKVYLTVTNTVATNNSVQATIIYERP